jgi:hypothetical protein
MANCTSAKVTRCCATTCAGDLIGSFIQAPIASEWIDGKFITPHDACFDADGNIYVVQCVPKLGRVTKLRKVS